VAAVAQTPATPELKKEDAAKTRLDFASQQVQTVRPQVAADLQYLVAEGAFANKKYADGVVAAGLQLVTKLRNDANLRFRFTGPRTGQKGRPKLYDGKVVWQDLRRFDAVDLSSFDFDAGVKGYTAELYHGSRKRWLRVVVLVWHTADGKRHHAIFATTDLQCTAVAVLEMDQARFQIEIVFTQMTKAHFFTCGAGWDDVTDFDLPVTNDHAINEQFDQLPALGEIEFVQGGLQPLAKCFNAPG
jgi:hypothetical protein